MSKEFDPLKYKPEELQLSNGSQVLFVTEWGRDGKVELLVVAKCARSGEVFTTSVKRNGRVQWGLSDHDHDITLKPRKPRKVRVRRWINLYPDGRTVIHADRETADMRAICSRIACIEIDREVEEGEGL